MDRSSVEVYGSAARVFMANNMDYKYTWRHKHNLYLSYK
jgi:hypothetical protein